MPKELFLALAIGLVLLVVAAGILAWRRRAARQSDVVAPDAAPAGFAPVSRHAADYVATTRRGAPYDRILGHGLGFRGRAEVLVGDEGVLVRLSERDVWIDARAIEDAELATWTIDRVVESGGLVVLGATLGTGVDIYLRPEHGSAALRDAVRQIIPAPATEGAQS